MRKNSELIAQYLALRWGAALKNIFSILLIVATIGGAVAQAQQPKKVLRIGYLSASDPATESARSDPIRLALRALGYVQGKNIVIDYRYAEGEPELLPDLATELVRLMLP